MEETVVKLNALDPRVTKVAAFLHNEFGCTGSVMAAALVVSHLAAHEQVDAEHLSGMLPDMIETVGKIQDARIAEVLAEGETKTKRKYDA